MLLSTHSAAELRILDSQPVSAQTKRISAEIFPVHPSCAPTLSSAASSSCLRQPSRRSRKLRFRYEDVRASSSLRRLPDSRFFFFLFFSLSLFLSPSFEYLLDVPSSISHHIGRNLFFVLSFNGKYLSSSSSGLQATTTTTTTTISEPFVLNCFYLAIQ